MIYRAGIVGCGRIGCGFDDDPKRTYIATHAGAYFNSEKVHLAALSDLDAEKLRKYAYKYNIPDSSLYIDYSEMLRKESLDILSICTSSSTHLEIIEKAAENGIKAIFCEKPIADTIKHASKIVDLCKRGGIILMIDHQRRFDLFHQEVKKILVDGRLGRIQQVHVYYTAGIANTGSHVFDLLRFFLGGAEYVQANYSNASSPNPEDSNLDGVVMFKNGVLCTIQACDVKHYLILEFDILGTLGRLKLTHSGFDIESYEIRDSHLFSGYKELFPSEKPIDVLGSREFMLNGVLHLVECLENKKQPISSGEDGLAAFELVCAFHESASSNGAKIFLPILNSDKKNQSK